MREEEEEKGRERQRRAAGGDRQRRRLGMGVGLGLGANLYTPFVIALLVSINYLDMSRPVDGNKILFFKEKTTVCTCDAAIRMPF